jgi:HK97 family phage portal protein
MGIFDFWKSKSLKDNNTQIIRQQVQAALQSITLSPNYKVYDNADRYCTTDDVHSVISLISTTAALIPLYGYLKSPDGKLTDLPENDPLALLLEMPFEGMTRFESIYAVIATKLMQGEYIIYKEKPELGPDKGKVAKLHYLEPYNVRIKVNTGFPRRTLYYQYVVNGVVIMDNIPPEDIIHGKYFNPEYGITGQELRGLSPLRVLAKRLTRIDSNNDVATAQLQNGGVPGIVFEKTYAESTSDVANKRKDNFYKYLSNSANKGAPFWDMGELGYIELGLKLADLQVSDLAKIDFKKLCNVFHVSDRLFNNDATGSEVSDKGARVALYSNCVIPLIMSIRDDFNKDLVKEFKGKPYYINYDISEVSELQDDYAQMVTWLEKAWWLSPNERREVMRFEKANEPLFDQYLLPTGLQTVEDLTMPDLTLTGDYNQPKP